MPVRRIHDGRCILKRYTDIPALIYLLRNQSITLLNPKSWDDTNDIYFLEQYKDKCGLKTLLALCFTGASETYHHWHVFSGGSSGVCITFKKEIFLGELSTTPGISHGEVKYKTINVMRKAKLEIAQLPYIKRYGFQDEGEYRLIFKDKTKEHKTKKLSSLSIV